MAPQKKIKTGHFLPYVDAADGTVSRRLRLTCEN